MKKKLTFRNLDFRFDQFGSMFGDDQRNTFMVKVSYWLSKGCSGLSDPL